MHCPFAEVASDLPEWGTVTRSPDKGKMGKFVVFVINVLNFLRFLLRGIPSSLRAKSSLSTRQLIAVGVTCIIVPIKALEEIIFFRWGGGGTGGFLKGGSPQYSRDDATPKKEARFADLTGF